MPKGIALTIGLNSVDPAHYAGWSGDLNACEADTEDMTSIGQSKRFSVTPLMTKAATRAAVINHISAAADELKSGDIFMVSYSGHGGQVPDVNRDEEADDEDETWCLYDGQLLDDELYNLWLKFKPAVRILVFSDSCHSGTVTKMAYYRELGGPLTTATNKGANGVVYRYMPPDAALRTYRNNRPFYEELGKKVKRARVRSPLKSSVLLFSGCQDSQLSSDGTFNGAFTAQLLRVWNEGRFKGDYRRFHKTILRRMPPDQTPNCYYVGEPNAAFEAQTPFTI